MVRYLLDSNIFIEAKNAYYPFDVFPAFWDRLHKLEEQNHLLSIDKVKEELCHHDDKLADWCKSVVRDTFFVESAACTSVYGEIAKWVFANTQYNEQAKSLFLGVDEADPWLVAYARTHGFVLVTHEASNPDSKNKIKLPDVCRQFNVQCIRTIDMLRNLQQVF